jgi:hypothetical protein
MTSVTPALAMVGIWMAGFLALSGRRVLADRRDGAYGLGRARPRRRWVTDPRRASAR